MIRRLSQPVPIAGGRSGLTLTCRLSGLLILCAATCVVSAARSYAQSMQVVFGPAPKHCTESEAVDAKVVDITADPGSFESKCVKVEGVWLDRSLYADEGAIYRDRAAHDPVNSGGPEDVGHIGIYASDSIGAKRGDFHKPANATLVGRVNTCAALNGPDTIMVLGYCHTDDGPFISPDQATFSVVDLSRMVSDDDRVRYGDLGMAPEGWPSLARAESLVTDWQTALVHSDVERLDALFQLTARHADPEDIKSKLHSLTTGPDGPASALRAATGPGEAQIFLYKAAGAAGPDPKVRDWDEFSVGCVCLVSSCLGLWPISEADAVDAPHHPYRCIQVYRGAGSWESTPGEWSLENIDGWSAFGEPW